MNKNITVRYFAGFREHAGVGEETVSVPAATAGDVYELLKDRHGSQEHKALGEKIPAEFRIVLVAFIGDGMADYETRAQDSLDRKAVEAATRAEEMASLLDKRDSVDFDLAKFGL